MNPIDRLILKTVYIFLLLHFHQMLFNEYNKIFYNVIEMEINRNIRYQSD